MLFQVEMDVKIPLDFDPEEAAAIKAKEKAYSKWNRAYLSSPKR